MKITKDFPTERVAERRPTPIKKDRTLSELNREERLPIELEHLSSDSIFPQLFVDSGMVLRDFTPPLGELFCIEEEDRGRSIYEVREKIGHRCLIGNIRGVMYTERNLEKEVQTENGEWYKLNIQPQFSPGEELVTGVIITFFKIR